jgi:hypothetical protein
MTSPGPAVSRRGLLALLGVVGASGCARNNSDAERPEDRYITAIKADPMFTWAPPGSSIRDVAYAPMVTSQPMPSSTSDVVVTYYISDSAALPEMVQRAKADSLTYGYSAAGYHYVGQNTGQILIRLDIGVAHDRSGIYLRFEAPARETP